MECLTFLRPTVHVSEMKELIMVQNAPVKMAMNSTVQENSYGCAQATVPVILALKLLS